MSQGFDTQSAEFERLLLHELRLTHQQLNSLHFKGSLRTPQFALFDVESMYARWASSTRTIEVARGFVIRQPWGVVVEVLKHEMAHQYVDETVSPSEPPHGPTFRRVCERLGIDAASGGLPRASAHIDPATAKLVDRIQKLLALAGSDNQHEAEAAAAAAQKLLLKHNLELPTDGTSRHYGFRQLGRITGRTQEWERRLGTILQAHFFVDVIWVSVFDVQRGQRGSVLEAIGSETSLELASYVYDFLARAAETLWQAHKRAHAIAGDKDRRVFFAGVMAGFGEKLKREQHKSRAEGLVWIADPELAGYYRQRHPRTRNIVTQGARKNDAFGHGKQAGHALVLHRGVTNGQSHGAPKLLKA